MPNQQRATTAVGKQQVLPLPVLCGGAYVLNFAGLLVLATSGASVNLLSSLIPSKHQARYLPVVLARFSALTALLDFFVVPVVGHVSDIYGRKPILLLACAVSSLCRFFSARTRSLYGYFCFGAVGMVAGSSFLATINAAFSDTYRSSKELAWATTTFNLFRGLSLILSPMLLGKLVGKNIRLAFDTSAALTACTGVIIAALFRETHDVGTKKAMVPSSAATTPTTTTTTTTTITRQRLPNPLAFLAFFQKSPKLFYLTCCNALQETTEPRTMGSVGTLLMSQQLAVTPVQYGQSIVATGIAMVAGPLLSRKYLIPRLSNTTFSLLTSICHSFALVFKVGGNLYWYYVGMLPSILGGQRLAISNAEFVHQAQADGMNSGEIAGAKANLDALIRVIAPIVYGRLFAANYRLPFLLGGGFTLLSQGFYYCASTASGSLPTGTTGAALR